MSDLKNFSVTVKNYKCFGPDEQGFEKILPVNLIIGRNNSGKSTLLEVIEVATKQNYKIDESLWHKNNPSIFFYESPLTELEIKPGLQASSILSVPKKKNYFHITM